MSKQIIYIITGGMMVHITPHFTEGNFDLDVINNEYVEEYTEIYMNWILSV